MKDKSLTLPEQDAMLARLCRKHGITFWEWSPTDVFTILAFGRELLLAVQERDADTVDGLMCSCGKQNVGEFGARRIREQTYADLFPEETK